MNMAADADVHPHLLSRNTAVGDMDAAVWGRTLQVNLIGFWPGHEICHTASST